MSLQLFTQMNEYYVAPFVEDDNCNITGDGHVDVERFIEQVYYYDRHNDIHAIKHSPEDVKHQYVRLEDPSDPESKFVVVSAYDVFNLDYAIHPVTTIWNVR